jgi:hypothetical protein
LLTGIRFSGSGSVPRLAEWKPSQKERVLEWPSNTLPYRFSGEGGLSRYLDEIRKLSNA